MMEGTADVDTILFRESGPIPSAKDVAEELYALAIKHGLLSTGEGPPVELEADAPDEDEPARANRFEQQSVLDAFHRRPIKLITFDDTNRVVTVFTDRPLGVRTKKRLPTGVYGAVNINYMASGTPEVRGSDADAHSPSPYYLAAGRYCCGSSVFPANRLGAGTFGVIVRDNEGNLFGITNNHVTGGCNHSELGLPILAPAPADIAAGRLDPFTIGHHHCLRPLHDGHPGMINIGENLDVAMFAIRNPDAVSSMQGAAFDTPASVIPLEPGMRVEKVGRSTGHTFGSVIGASVSPLAVFYEMKEMGIRKFVHFNGDQVFAVKADNDTFFSRGGDSGSLVTHVDAAGTRHAVGLVFAGNEGNKLSFILPLSVALAQLDVSIVSGHGAP